MRGPLPRDINVEVLPWFGKEGVRVETEQPGLREFAAVAICTEHEWHVRAGELGHLLVEVRALGTVRQDPRLLEETVELRQTEASVVHTIGDVLAIEDFERDTPVAQRDQASQSEHLELARLAHLQEIGPLLLDKFDAD